MRVLEGDSDLTARYRLSRSFFVRREIAVRIYLRLADIDGDGIENNFDCSSDDFDLDSNPWDIICPDGTCTPQYCCTEEPIITCGADPNNNEQPFDCTGHRRTVDMDQTCNSQLQGGCRVQECCTGDPRPITCGDVMGDGTNREYECTEGRNSLDQNPTNIECDGSGCDYETCCTISRTCANVNADVTMNILNVSAIVPVLVSPY